MNLFTSSFSIAYQNIRNNLFHTFLSVLGVIIGVASLVVILSLTESLELVGRSELERTTPIQSISLTSLKTEVIDDIRVPISNRIQFTYEHLTQLEQKIPTASLDMLEQTTGYVFYEETELVAKVLGVTENTTFLKDKVIKGRSFTEGDINSANKVAIISKELAEKCSIDTLKHDFIIWKGESYEVIGILQKDGASVLMIPITSLKYDADTNPQLFVKVEEVEDVEPTLEIAQDWVDENFPNQSKQIVLSSYLERAKQFKQAILLFKLILGAITGVSIIVGGIGVMNVLLISVTQRTKEIGIRKAVGASNKFIVLQFLFESITISIIGSLIGLVFGFLSLYIFAPLAKNLTNIPFSIYFNPINIILVAIIAILVGVIFGTYPAIKASRLNPEEAIRIE